MRHLCQNFILITASLILMLCPPGFTSDKVITVVQSDKFNIHFTGQINRTEDLISSQSFLSTLWNIFAGNSREQLVKPFSILHGKSEKLFVLDQGACKIYMYDRKNKESSTFDLPEMLSLISMALLPDSTIIFSDSEQNKVYKLKPDEEDISLFIQNTPLNRPTGLACNPVNGQVWVVETKAHRLSVFNSDGEFIKSIGKRGSGFGEFNYPTAVCIDTDQRIYVVDAMNQRIQIFNSAGHFLSTFGQAGDGSGDLARPKGIACDSYGHIYVVDGLFHNIQIFDLEGRFLAQFGSQGHGPAEFWMPAGIFIDEKNKIYVADTYNARVQVFQLEAGQ